MGKEAVEFPDTTGKHANGVQLFERLMCNVHVARASISAGQIT